MRWKVPAQQMSATVPKNIASTGAIAMPAAACETIIATSASPSVAPLTNSTLASR